LAWSVLLVVGSSLVTAAIGGHASAETADVAERWIVIVDPDVVTDPAAELGSPSVSDLDGVVSTAGARERELLPGVWSVDARTGARLIGVAGVVEARPEARIHAAVVPNDPCVSSCGGFSSGQWHLPVVRAPEAWDLTTGDGSVTVAVVDSGIRDTHVELANVLRVSGCGLAPLSTGLDHGTFVAGLIGAVTDNGLQIAGMAWDVDILDVRVLTTSPKTGLSEGVESDLVTGIMCAADNGADVINLSLVQGESVALQPVAEAITYAQSRGSLVVAAAGNGGTTAPQYPASYDGVLAVAGTDSSGGTWSQSDRGLWAELSAPAALMLSLDGGSNFAVTVSSGTSFAAPVVSGAAALVAARFPSMDMHQVGRRLAWSSRPYGPGGEVEFGILDTYEALVQPFSALWMATDNGQVIALGDAPHLGDLAGTYGAPVVPLNQPIVGMAASPSGAGYWLVASDGGLFAFGDAGFFGSLGALTLNQPIVGMAASPLGAGYWLVASDGGVFTFGDAVYAGSVPEVAGSISQPVVSMVGGQGGYGLTAADGGVFNFDLRYLGSAGATALSGPVVSAAMVLS